MTAFTSMTKCLACGGTHLQRYLDLGEQPLANAFHDGAREQKRFPLGLNVCLDCFHSQQLGAVDPHLMFDDYPYVSGTTATLREYFEHFVFHVEATMGHKDGVMPSMHVIDIGSNDGSLLKVFRDHGHNVIGIDPARNLVGGEAMCGYWDRDMADHVLIGGPKFDVVVALNVLAHVADPLEFLVQAKRVLAPGGRIFVQTSQAKMVERAEFDTCYHEHHSFFTVSSFLALAHRAGLYVKSIDHVPVHGTSYLVELIDEARDTPSRFDEFAIGRDENAHGYYTPQTYLVFQRAADAIRHQVKNLIEGYRAEGYCITGFGAAAKAMTFLNYIDVKIDCIIDENPMKIGKITPGMNIPVISADADLTVTSRTLFVILAWNFRDEIMAKIKARRDRIDDAFLTCFPRVTLT